MTAAGIFKLLTSLGEDTLAFALILLVLGVVGQIILVTIKHRNERAVAALSAEEALQRHNSEISIQLLEQLRAELSRAITENARLAPYVERARALARHLEEILCADTDEERMVAEDAARAYLATLDQTHL